MKVLVDPGHGGTDPGACANGMRECDYVLNVSKLLIATLRQRGHEAHITREADVSLGYDKQRDLQARCEIEHLWKPNLFLSIHCNAAMADTARGFEVWTSPGQTRSDRAAECLVNAFSHNFPDRLVRRDMSDGDSDKESQFKVLVGTNGPAVLVELGFLTNAEEAYWLKDQFIKIVTTLADGVDLFAREAAA